MADGVDQRSAEVEGYKSPAPLFRREVLVEREAGQLGTILMASPISHRVFTGFAIATAAGVVALLAFGEFTRKAQIRGWLVPQQGLVRIHPPQPGIASEVYVKEGMEVSKGAPLLKLSTELQSEALGATRREIVRRLGARRDSLVKESKLRAQLHARAFST